MKRLFVILLPLLFAACTLIDDDLSVCGKQVLINYQLQLHTELSVQLQAELQTEPELPVRRALERWLAPVFAGTEADVDLRFYSAELDELAVHRQDSLRDKHASFTIILPKEYFRHLAVANMYGNPEVQIMEDEHSSTMYITLPDEPELSSLREGMYAARMPIEVIDSMKQMEVSMYMINAAVALVMETSACSDVVAVDGYLSGSATGFSIYDSTFIYVGSPIVWLDRVTLDGSSVSHRAARAAGDLSYMCMAGVSLPTQDSTAWSMTLTTTLTDNRHTTTTLTVDEPLAAGSLRLIKLLMGEDGELTPDTDANAEVGATVKLDWQKGDEHEIEI